MLRGFVLLLNILINIKHTFSNFQKLQFSEDAYNDYVTADIDILKLSLFTGKHVFNMN